MILFPAFEINLIWFIGSVLNLLSCQMSCQMEAGRGCVHFFKHQLWDPVGSLANLTLLLGSLIPPGILPSPLPETLIIILALISIEQLLNLLEFDFCLLKISRYCNDMINKASLVANNRWWRGVCSALGDFLGQHSLRFPRTWRWSCATQWPQVGWFERCDRISP